MLCNASTAPELKSYVVPHWDSKFLNLAFRGPPLRALTDSQALYIPISSPQTWDPQPTTVTGQHSHGASGLTPGGHALTHLLSSQLNPPHTLLSQLLLPQELSPKIPGLPTSILQPPATFLPAAQEKVSPTP